MSTLPDSVYDDAVRTYLRVPARHHISIGHLRATIDDPAAFRAALTVAYEAGAEDARGEPTVAIDIEHLARQRDWSYQTFGPGPRTHGVIDHIRKELGEIEADPTDLGEWVDVIMLALDGAWRSGAEPAQIIAAVKTKQAVNEARLWPDWRTQSESGAIEHIREALVAEARASVALDGETVTLDGPQVTP